MDQLMQTLGSVAPLIMIVAMVYFFSLRPQSQRMKKHREMLAHLKKGDAIITASGIFATVRKIEDQEVHIELSKDVVVRIQKDHIAGLAHGHKGKTSGEVGPKQNQKDGAQDKEHSLTRASTQPKEPTSDNVTSHEVLPTTSDAVESSDDSNVHSSREMSDSSSR